MKSKFLQPKTLLISFVIMYSISGFQYLKKQIDYLKLEKEGIITSAELTYTPIKRIICEYKFEFTKADGTRYVSIKLE